jgi:hypothetical protein
MNGHLRRCFAIRKEGDFQSLLRSDADCCSAPGADVFVGAYCNTPLRVRCSRRLASGAFLNGLR